jgi:hypothetical protein
MTQKFTDVISGFPRSVQSVTSADISLNKEFWTLPQERPRVPFPHFDFIDGESAREGGFCHAGSFRILEETAP